jgi:acetylornithine aminotransferase
VQEALDAGLLINVTADTVIRLLPPLNFTRAQAGMLVDTLVPLILAFLSRQSTAHPATQPA